MSFPRYPKYKDSGVEWLGEVPEHWVTCSFRHCLSQLFNGLTATQVNEAEYTVPVTRIETISNGVIDESRLGFISRQDAREDRILLEGDILFSNINSLNMVGNCAFYTGGRTIYAGMNLLVLRPAPRCTPRWLYWLVRSASFRCVVESLAKPAINQASVSQSSISSIVVSLPPISEQTQIAAFLDQETAKIDELVAQQRRLIELLKEKRQAVISHAVTKGLNPDAPMKPSGIEWLGDVPEHWEVVPFSLAIDFQEGPGIMAVDFHEEGIPLLRVSGVQGRWAALDGCNYLDPEKVATRWSHFQLDIGDLIISASASMGTVCEVGPDAAGAVPYTGLIRLTSRNNAMTRDYIRVILGSVLFHTQIDLLKAGATIQHFGPTHLQQMKVLLPPLDEQDELASFVATETAKLDALTAEAQRAIDLLQERRTALISAAVTGQIDVRPLSGKKPA